MIHSAPVIESAVPVPQVLFINVSLIKTTILAERYSEAIGC